MELKIKLTVETIDEAIAKINKLRRAYPEDKLTIKVTISDYFYLE